MIGMKLVVIENGLRRHDIIRVILAGTGRDRHSNVIIRFVRAVQHIHTEVLLLVHWSDPR